MVKSKATVAIIPLVITVLSLLLGIFVLLSSAASSKDSDKNNKREQILASNLQVRTTESVTLEMQSGLVEALEQVRVQHALLNNSSHRHASIFPSPVFRLSAHSPSSSRSDARGRPDADVAPSIPRDSRLL